MLSATGKNTGGIWLGLHLMGGTRANTLNGKLQNTLKHHLTSSRLKEWIWWSIEPCWSESCSEGWGHCWFSMMVSTSYCSQLPWGEIHPIGFLESTTRYKEKVTLRVVGGQICGISYWCSNSIKGSTTKGGSIQPTWEIHTWSAQFGWIRRLWNWRLEDTYYIRTL